MGRSSHFSKPNYFWKIYSIDSLTYQRDDRSRNNKFTILLHSVNSTPEVRHTNQLNFWCEIPWNIFIYETEFVNDFKLAKTCTLNSEDYHMSRIYLCLFVAEVKGKRSFFFQIKNHKNLSTKFVGSRTQLNAQALLSIA